MMGKLILVGISVIAIVACKKSDTEVARKVSCKDGVLIDAGIFGGQKVQENTLLEKEISAGTIFVYSKSDSIDEETGEHAFDLCTASLIDNNIALTAAHCVSDENLREVSSLKVAFSLDPICQAKTTSKEATLREATQLIRHESYMAGSKSFSKNDLALVRFSGKAPENKKSMKLLLSEVSLNSLSEILVTGYGKTTDYNQRDENGPVLRFAKISPLLISQATEKITETNKNPVLYFDQSNGEGACAGDSGGPTLLKKDNDIYVIGINSAVDSLGKDEFKTQNDVTCFKGLRSTSVLAQKEWIFDNYKKIINSDSKGILSR